MLEKIIALDTELFIYLNGLGSSEFDSLWLFITKQFNWAPLFVLLLFLIYKKLGTKQTLYLLLFVSLLITATDQIANVFKYSFQRIRPCNNPEINSFIRIVQVRKSFSFFSGHAANTMAVSVFLYLLLKSHYKYFGFLFLWPLIFAYSRIYLGLHYPLDILSGYLFGVMTGCLCYKLYRIMQKKYFPLLPIKSPDSKLIHHE